MHLTLTLIDKFVLSLKILNYCVSLSPHNVFQHICQLSHITMEHRIGQFTHSHRHMGIHIANKNCQRKVCIMDGLMSATSAHTRTHPHSTSIAFDPTNMKYFSLSKKKKTKCNYYYLCARRRETKKKKYWQHFQHRNWRKSIWNCCVVCHKRRKHTTHFPHHSPFYINSKY